MKNINESMEQLRRSLDERMNEIRRKNEEFMNRYSQPYGTDAHEDSHDEEEQMYCAECGARVNTSALFCDQCGSRLDEELDENDDDQKWCEDSDDTSSDEQDECPVDWEDFEDCGFTYTYESDGEEREVEVTYENCEDADGEEFYCWCSEDGPIDIYDDDFRGCEDINDCGVVIAKRVIHDNDGEVKMSFGKGELTFTDQPCAIVLDEKLNYSTDCEKTVTLTLYANQRCDVMRTYFYELDEKAFKSICQLIEDEETDEILDYVDEDFFCNETFDLMGDEDAERLAYEITDSNGDVIDEGGYMLQRKMYSVIAM